MTNLIEQLIAFLRQYDGINDKAKLAKLVSDNFHLTKDRSVYCPEVDFGCGVEMRGETEDEVIAKWNRRDAR